MLCDYLLQEKRLRLRNTESEDSLQKRLKTATEEMIFGSLTLSMLNIHNCIAIYT